MATMSFLDRLAVCSWSLQPSDPKALVEATLATGIRRVQLALDPLREKPEVWSAAPELLARNGISIVSGMFGTLGEDYSTLETIRRTGGVVPDETWENNWRNIQDVAQIASRLGVKLVTFHAGFLPHEEDHPDFRKLFERIRRIGELFAGVGIDLGFETGQETAFTLREFMEKLKLPGVGVNFDPANMLLYNKGDPIDALRTLGPWLKQCHIKDARRTQVSGAWGEEVVVGTGEVPWREFFQTLAKLNFGGWCCIEREAGNHRVADVRSAFEHVKSIFP